MQIDLNIDVNGTLSDFDHLTPYHRAHKFVTEEVQNVIDSCIQMAASEYPTALKGVDSYTHKKGLIHTAFRVTRKSGYIHIHNPKQTKTYAVFRILGNRLIIAQPNCELKMSVRDMYVVARSEKEKLKKAVSRRDFLPLGGSFGLGKKQLACCLLKYGFNMKLFHKEDESVTCYEPVQDERGILHLQQSHIDIDDFIRHFARCVGDQQVEDDCLLHALTLPDLSTDNIWEILTTSHVLLGVEGKLLDHVRFSSEGYVVYKSTSFPIGLRFLNGIPFSPTSGHESIMLVTRDITEYTNAYRSTNLFGNRCFDNFNNVHIPEDLLKYAFEDQSSPWTKLLLTFHNNPQTKKVIKGLLNSEKKKLITKNDWDQVPRTVQERVKHHFLVIEVNDFTSWLYERQTYDDDGDVRIDHDFPRGHDKVLRFIMDDFPNLREFPLPSRVRDFCSMCNDVGYKKYSDALLDSLVYDPSQYNDWMPDCLLYASRTRLAQGRWLINRDFNDQSLMRLLEYDIWQESSFTFEYLSRCLTTKTTPSRAILMNRPSPDTEDDNEPKKIRALLNEALGFR